ncbi:MAG: hypothetical protein HRT44_06610, partial [Bdellovibrionales bacterium]|nr:hypothetical protein [Bdellovibrionales bacterium]NQZ18911.1 hypothetical protein [Bdellovibrionales bacterium]
AFTNNGSETVRINASGDVGIGTNSPSEKLHINNGDLLLDGKQYPGIILETNNTTAGNSSLTLRGGRAVANGRLGSVNFQNVNSSIGSVARIRGNTGTAADTGQIEFETRSTTDTEPQPLMRVDEDGIDNIIRTLVI